MSSLKGTRCFSVVVSILTLIVSWFTPTPIEAQAAEIPDSEKAAENLSEKQIQFIDSCIEWAIDLGDKVEEEYGGKPPTTAVISESAYESGWGESGFSQLYNNDFGIGGVANPKAFGSHYASWVYYYDLVSTREGYVINGSLKANNTYEYISALVAGGYCSDEGYLRDVLSIANKIKPYVDAREAEIRAEREKAEKPMKLNLNFQKEITRQLDMLVLEQRVPK